MDNTIREGFSFSLYRALRGPVRSSRVVAWIVLQSKYLASLTNDPAVSSRPGTTLAHIAIGYHSELADTVFKSEYLSNLRDENGWSTVHTGARASGSAATKAIGNEKLRMKMDQQGSIVLGVGLENHLDVAAAVAGDRKLQPLLELRDGKGTKMFDLVCRAHLSHEGCVAVSEGREPVAVLGNILRNRTVLASGLRKMPHRVLA